MATQAKRLASKKRNIKGQLTRFQSFVDAFDNSMVEELKLRLHKINCTWDEFHDTQLEITSLEAEDFETQQKETELFEEQYFKLVSKANKLLAQITHDTDNASNISAATSHAKPNHIKLPTIELPKFNGRYDQWYNFYDTFKSIIHDDPNVSDVHKFHYLKASLIGEASTVVQSLDVSSANYAIAWQLLKDRYDNKRFIIQNHVKALFELPAVIKDQPLSLRNLLDVYLKHIRALTALGQPTDQWDVLLIYLITSRLDKATHKDWEDASKGKELPSIVLMIEFLEQRCRILEAVAPSGTVSSKQIATTTKSRHDGKRHTQAFTSQTKGCPVCSKGHNIYNCPRFLKLSIEQRLNEVKKANLCSNCLRKGHTHNQCSSRKCSNCSADHNSLLHPTTPTNHNQTAQQPSANPSVATTAAHTAATNSQLQVLLSTAVIQVQSGDGTFYPCRVLLDSGSQSNFMTEHFATKIKLKRKFINMPVIGISDSNFTIKFNTITTIKSRNNTFYKTTNFLLLPKITGSIPNCYVDRQYLNIPGNVELADPKFDQPSEVDMLLGVELFYDVLEPQQMQLENKMSVLQNTKFGWVIAGRVPQRQQSRISCYLTLDDLSKQIENFWEIDECSEKRTVLSPEEQACEEHFRKHTSRDSTGRFVVRLPFNERKSELGVSYNIALKRFSNLERKLNQNSQLHEQYSAFMAEYKVLNHMTEDREYNGTGCFLPHHPVVKEDSLTTKVRVVFDASAKTTTNVALNDTLMIGPTIQDDLFSILIRFRTHEVVFTADIEKMYRQIRVHEEDARYQKILWRCNSTEPVQEYILNTVTYGTSCAPFLATRCLQELAEQETHQFPTAAQVIKKDFYVDDLLSGAKCVEDARILKAQIADILQRGGFKLRKWASNKCELLEFGDDTCKEPLLNLNTDKLKVLGIVWNPQQDSLIYTANISEAPAVLTKRAMLSQIARLYDPMGLLGPVIITAKITMQKLWTLKTGWDEPVPPYMSQNWTQFLSDLPAINNLVVSRKIVVKDPINIQLHGFSDASESAYGACIYVKSENEHNEQEMHLVCAKSRVAPLKRISLPRLELCAAELLVTLYKHVVKSLRLNICSTTFWSDSTIVLSWINMSPHLLKTFVSNRISKIQGVAKPNDWRHISSSQNPADIISRGCKASELISNQLWWHGPPWILENEIHWPVQSSFEGKAEQLPEIRPVVSNHSTTVTTNEIFIRFSRFSILVRVVAWIFRFRNNASNSSPKVFGPVSVQELNTAKRRLTKLAQSEVFKEEIKILRQGKPLNKGSQLVTLNPYLDSEGILRVGGRLQRANITFEQQHPAVLSKNHPLTNLIIKYFHEKYLHAGPTATLAHIRTEFWPLSGKAAVRGVLRNCITCFRAKPPETVQQMGILPKGRVNISGPFTITGVEYAGPLQIREHKHRGRIKITKCYIAVFVCFITKAIHLELVSDLTCDAFISALRRFIARRGNCREIHSDNATNFIAAEKELKQFFEFLKSSDCQANTQRFLANESISWHFSPARSPHHGGLWEAAVKSVKHHLKRVARNALLTFEELYTLLTQIEAVVNSRPLCPLTNDPNDLTPLTPAHFLLGDSRTGIIDEPTLLNEPMNRLSRWQYIQRIKQEFWKRWSREYLSQLHQRTRWNLSATPITPGKLVLLKDENHPPARWPLGRIQEVYPGEDGVVRVVSVKTNSGIFRRAVQKICLLPVDDNQHQGVET